MARTINVLWNDEEAEFKFRPIDRKVLYGKRRRVAFDEKGQECTRASLLGDGSLLLKSGMTGQGYFLPSGEWLPQGDLEGILPDGSPAELVPGTLGTPVPLEGPIPLESALDLKVQTVYLLEPETLPDRLADELAKGSCFSFMFNYRSDYRAETGILMSNDEGVWALIGLPITYEWSDVERSVAFVPDEEDDADDLDFEMF